MFASLESILLNVPSTIGTKQRVCVISSGGVSVLISLICSNNMLIVSSVAMTMFRHGMTSDARYHHPLLGSNKLHSITRLGSVEHTDDILSDRHSLVRTVVERNIVFIKGYLVPCVWMCACVLLPRTATDDKMIPNEIYSEQNVATPHRLVLETADGLTARSVERWVAKGSQNRNDPQMKSRPNCWCHCQQSALFCVSRKLDKKVTANRRFSMVESDGGKRCPLFSERHSSEWCKTFIASVLFAAASLKKKGRAVSGC